MRAEGRARNCQNLQVSVEGNGKKRDVQRPERPVTRLPRGHGLGPLSRNREPIRCSRCRAPLECVLPYLQVPVTRDSLRQACRTRSRCPQRPAGSHRSSVRVRHLRCLHRCAWRRFREILERCDKGIKQLRREVRAEHRVPRTGYLSRVQLRSLGRIRARLLRGLAG